MRYRSPSICPRCEYFQIYTRYVRSVLCISPRLVVSGHFPPSSVRTGLHAFLCSCKPKRPAARGVSSGDTEHKIRGLPIQSHTKIMSRRTVRGTAQYCSLLDTNTLIWWERSRGCPISSYQYCCINTLLYQVCCILFSPRGVCCTGRVAHEAPWYRSSDGLLNNATTENNTTTLTHITPPPPPPPRRIWQPPVPALVSKIQPSTVIFWL